MLILVACEFSGRVRDAFLAAGQDAISCDLLPSEVPGPHIRADVREVLHWGWDMMVAHPPCTYLANSGVRWLYNPDGTKNEDRWENLYKDAAFFNALLNAPIPKIAVENPIQHIHARELIRKRDQVLHPRMFGHGESKTMWFWLKGLPRLVPTNIVEESRPTVHREPPSPERWKNRSRTYTGLAEAMAAQWSEHVRQTT